MYLTNQQQYRPCLSQVGFRCVVRYDAIIGQVIGRRYDEKYMERPASNRVWCVVIFVVSYYIMMCRIIRAHMVCWEMKAVSCWTPKHGRMLFKFTYQLFISFPKFILYDFTECFRYSIYHSTHLHSSEMTIGWILWKMCSVLRTI